MSRRTAGLGTGVAACVAALAFAVAALAATPKPGIFISGGEGGAGFTVTSNHKTIKKNGTAPSTFKCNRSNLVVPTSIPIKSGAFYYHGRVEGQKGTLTFKGTFVSSTKATGKSTFVKGSCKNTVKFTAKHI